MKQFDYIVWKEGKCYVSQCDGNNTCSFKSTLVEAVEALIEALELYYEDEGYDYHVMQD